MQVKFTEDIVPVTDFRNNAADILAQLLRNGRPIVLTQRGRASAVLLDVREYQRLTERLAVLEGQAGKDPLAQGLVPPTGSGQADPDESTNELLADLQKWLP